MGSTNKEELSIDEIKGPYYPCLISEQETVVTISRDEKTATVYTNDLTTLTKCRRVAKTPGSQWRLVKIDRMGKNLLQCGWTFMCPKRLISFRSKSLSKPKQKEAIEAMLEDLD